MDLVYEKIRDFEELQTLRFKNKFTDIKIRYKKQGKIKALELLKEKIKNYYEDKNLLPEIKIDTKEKKRLRNKKYCDNNQEKERQRTKIYRNNNQEKIQEYRKQEIICSCGCKIKLGGKANHLKTKKHFNYLQFLITTI